MSALHRPVGAAADDLALTDGRTTLGWGQLDAVLDRAVAALRSLDTGPDRRVAVLAVNSAETVVAHAAVLLAGLSAVPVSPHLKVPEVEYILDVARARVVLAGPETAATAQAARGNADVYAWRTADLDGVQLWEELVEPAALPLPADDVAPRPPMLFTSGTTGRPKPVEQPPTMFPGGNSGRELVARLRENPLAQFAPHLVAGPLHHTGPLTAVRLLLAGVPLVVLPRFDAEAALRAISQHRVQASVMVPTHFARLLALPQEVRDAYDVSSLREVVHTGAACPVPLKRRMLEWWGPVLNEAYGGTEVGTTNSITAQEWLEHPGSVGRTVPPYEVLVLDDNGREMPTASPGRLCFRDTSGRGLVYADPAYNASDLPSGVFTLGEIGYVDHHGYVYITDRSVDLVVSGGVNVYPAEAEVVLQSLPGVVDAVAFGTLHPEMGEQLRALVVVDDPACTDQSLLAACRELLAHYKCPRSITLVDELPRTAMGKIDKRALRAQHGGGVAVAAP